jgi:DNA-binding MarR family transcriptional regulator
MKKDAVIRTPRPSIFYLLTTVESVMSRSLDAELRHVGITQGQMIALIRISEEHKLSSARLARLLDTSAQTVVLFVRALESKGLIERSGAEQTGRALAIEVTASGRAVLEKLRAIVREAEGKILAGIPAQHREIFRQTLVHILEKYRPLALTEWSPLLAPPKAPNKRK